MVISKLGWTYTKRGTTYLHVQFLLKLKDMQLSACTCWLALPVLIIAQDTDNYSDVAAMIVSSPDQIFHACLGAS